MIIPRTKKLYDIDPRAWEHPADRAALSVLAQIPGLDRLVKTVFGLTTERSVRLMHVASSVRCTPLQFSRLYATLDQVADTFDWKEKPELFVTQSPSFNACTFGVDKPCIVLNSALCQSLDDAELAAVIAHELAHIMSGHAVYKTLLWLLTNISFAVFGLPELLIMPVVAALREWDRKSELSADRAELLAIQDQAPCYHLLMKAAGGNDLGQMDLEEFFRQAAEYEEGGALLDGLLKVLNTVWQSHPFPVVRLAELKSWSDSGRYAAILDGNYPKRGYSRADPFADTQEAFKFYTQGSEKPAQDGEDPVAKAAKALGEGLGKAAKGLDDALRGIFGDSGQRG